MKSEFSSSAPLPMLWMMRGVPFVVLRSLTIMMWGRFPSLQVTMSPGL